MKHKFTQTLVFLLFLAATVSAQPCQYLAYDGFDYAAWLPLHGLSGGSAQSVGRCYFGISGERKKPGNAAVHHRYDGAPGFSCARMCERGGKYYPGESGKYPRRYLSNPDSGNWRDQNGQVRIKIRARPAAGIHHTERRNRPRGSFPAME